MAGGGTMFLLVPVAGVAHATSYTHEPTVAEAFAAASVVIHGVVTQTRSCVGSRAWTFIDLEVGEVIRGTLQSEEFASFSSGESLLAAEELALTCDPGPLEWAWSDPLATAV